MEFVQLYSNFKRRCLNFLEYKDEVIGLLALNTASHMVLCPTWKSHHEHDQCLRVLADSLAVPKTLLFPVTLHLSQPCSPNPLLLVAATLPSAPVAALTGGYSLVVPSLVVTTLWPVAPGVWLLAAQPSPTKNTLPRLA